jgi:hypothetical protein
MKRTTRIGFVLALAVGLALGACSSSKDTSPTGTGENQQPQPPTLPDLSTMTIDLSFFQQYSGATTDAGHGFRRSAGQVPGSNFLNAAVRAVALWSFVEAFLAMPVTVYAVALHSVPQPQPDGSWLWTYVFVDSAGEYTVYLTGVPGDGYVDFAMRVSSTDPALPLDHFLWFEGRVMDPGTQGFWQFYVPDSTVTAAAAYPTAAQTPGIPCVRIDWSETSDSSDLSFLVNYPSVPETGDSLHFHADPSVHRITYTDADQGTTGIVEWYPDHSGFIQWPDYNGGAKSCWNALLQDVPCP